MPSYSTRVHETYHKDWKLEPRLSEQVPVPTRSDYRVFIVYHIKNCRVITTVYWTMLYFKQVTKLQKLSHYVKSRKKLGIIRDRTQESTLQKHAIMMIHYIEKKLLIAATYEEIQKKRRFKISVTFINFRGRYENSV